MIFPYLTLHWDLYLSKYTSFKGAEYCYGRDSLLQPTSLLSGCHSQRTASQSGSSNLFTTREKEVYFQLENLTFIYSQPLPCSEAVSIIIQKAVPLTLCAQILWWSPYFTNTYWKKMRMEQQLCCTGHCGSLRRPWAECWIVQNNSPRRGGHTEQGRQIPPCPKPASRSALGAQSKEPPHIFRWQHNSETSQDFWFISKAFGSLQMWWWRNRTRMEIERETETAELQLVLDKNRL